MMSEGVSVIIACYNSEKVISKTLEYLQAQKNYDNIPWEVILVDNNSTDKTSAVAKAIWDKKPIVPLRILLETKVGEANARRTGIIAAQYGILSIVDDDNWVAEDWIYKIDKYFQNPEIGLLGCAGEGVYEETPPEWFEDNKNAFAIGSLYEGDFVDITEWAFVPGAGLSVRKLIYDYLFENNWKPLLEGRVGNTQSAGADSEMCLITRHLGYKIFYSNDLHFKHFTAKHRITWERLKNMTQGFGESDVFTLPYKILYYDRCCKSSIFNSFRRFWWFNYFAKKVALFIKDPLPFIRKVKYDPKILIRIRNKAFTNRIWKERKKFESSFEILDQIKRLK